MHEGEFGGCREAWVHGADAPLRGTSERVGNAQIDGPQSSGAFRMPVGVVVVVVVLESRVEQHLCCLPAPGPARKGRMATVLVWVVNLETLTSDLGPSALTYGRVNGAPWNT